MVVGEITKCLDDNGLTENTLVIFTSDNGAMMNLAGRNAVKAGHKINGDLLGFKFGVWEGGHRVPLIANGPARLNPERSRINCSARSTCSPRSPS